MKNTPLLILFLFFSVFSLAQEIILKGRISIHNSKYKTGAIEYVQDAYINADSAGSTQTDLNGKFRLIFQSVTPGDEVVLTVEKDQLEVVNRREVLNIILGRIAPIKIYLAPKGQLAKAQTELYEISLAMVTARYNALIKELREGGIKSEAVIKQLEKQLNREIEHRFAAEEILHKQLEEIKKRLPETVKKLAIINLDFASDTYRQAYEYYKSGEIDQAIALLNEAPLITKTSAALSRLEQTEKDRTNYQLALEQQEEQVNQIIQCYTLKSEAYKLIFDYRSAANVYQKVVGLLEKTKGIESLELADAYDVLGELYRDLGEYQTALDYYIKNVTIKEQLLAINDPELANANHNLAAIYRDLGQYIKALEVQHKAITIQAQNPKSNYHTALFYHNLAAIHQSLGQCKKALQAQQNANVAIQDPITTSPFQDEITSTEKLQLLVAYHNNLAIIYLCLNDSVKALSTLDKVITDIEQQLSKDHPGLATTYSNLSAIYQNLGILDKSLKNQLAAIRIREKTLEPNHPDLAISYNNLSSILLKMEKSDSALIAQRKALEIQQQVLAPNHPSIADSYHNLVFIFKHFNQLDSAIYYEKLAFQIWDAALPPPHQYLKYAKTNLAILYSEKGDNQYNRQNYIAAIRYYNLALNHSAKNPVIHNSIGLSYLSLKNYSQAIKYFEKSYQLDSEKKAIYLGNTGMAYAKSGHFNIAKNRFEELQKLTPNNGLVYRYWAVYYALKRNKERALSNLEKAIELGYKNAVKIIMEEAFKILHKEPRYQAIIQKLQNQQ